MRFASVLFGLGACTPVPGSVPGPLLTEAAGAASEEVWSPGDPIPGWDDFDCGTLAEGAGSVTIHLPDVSAAEVVFYSDYETRSHSFLLADCGDAECAGEDAWEDLEASRAGIGASAYGGDPTSRGQGWYVYPSESHSGGFDVWLINGTMYSPSWHVDEVDGSICLSRVRPDMIEGVVRIVKVTGIAYESVWYSPVVILVPFTISFVDHSSLDSALDTDPDLYPPPAGAEHVWYHFADYDRVWPWDEITDPAIKDAVYARYTPWNWP